MRTLTIALAAAVALALPPEASAQADVRSGFFTTSDGAELHYLEAGAGPLIVLVPGWTLPATTWSAQIEYLADMAIGVLAFFIIGWTIAYGAGLFSPDMDFATFGSRFHGNDERIDIESLRLTTELWERVILHLMT